MRIRAITSISISVAVVLLLSLYRPSPAFATSIVTITKAREGVFLLQGIGIEDAAALDIIVVYDTATLANPRVTEGPLIAGAMTAINPKVPGTVRMAVVRLTPVKGSGVIATLAFDRTGSSPGKITSLSVRLANIRGSSLPALVRIENASEAFGTASDLPNDQTMTTGTAIAR
ncbi:MAG TPA: cohesin domain-containing protein [Nitrospirota bacterium]|nr:cohesin domain-containing protein [Nitrospirota bacterium]